MNVIGMTIDGPKVNNFRFADGIVRIADKVGDFRQILQKFHTWFGNEFYQN